MIWDRLRRKKTDHHPPHRAPPPFDIRPLTPPADPVLVPIDLTRLPAETLAAMELPVDGSRPADWPNDFPWPPAVPPEVLWLLDPTAPRPARLPADQPWPPELPPEALYLLDPTAPRPADLPPDAPWPPELPPELLWALNPDGPPPPGWPTEVPWPPEAFWPTPPSSTPTEPPPDPPPHPYEPPWGPPPFEGRGRGPGGYIGDVRPLRRAPEPEWAAPPVPPPAPPAGGRVARFRGDAGALALVGALEDQAVRCHRAPDGAVCVPIPEVAQEIALALGAEVGSAPDFADWPLVTAAELAAAVAVPVSGPDRSEVSVLTPGLLAAPLVRSCLDSGLPVTVTAVELRRADAARPAVLLRVGGAGVLPKSLLRTTSALPDTVVCREVGPSLLVDHRARYPVDDEVLAASVPAGRRWVVMSDGSGVWDVVATHRETTPALALPVAPPARHPATTPVDRVAIGIALVRDDTTADRIDATLVSDDDLPALRVFLAHGPAREALHVVPGPGWHLLVEPGGTTDPVPFGVPLARSGPDGLYLESGTALRPRPPANALVEHFGLSRGTVVVATADGAFRFRAEDAVPAWTLWLEDPPEVRGGLSPTAEKLLARLDEVARPPKPAPEAVGAPEHEPAQRVGLISAATRLELSGDLAAAARQLELAGDFYRAARLYEQAAEESGTEDGGP